MRKASGRKFIPNFYGHTSRRGTPWPRAAGRFRPFLEWLEDRLTPSSNPSGGWTPEQLRGYYGLDQIQFNTPSGAVPGDGRGETIVVIMDGLDPAMVSSDQPGWLNSPLAIFSQTFSLPYNAAGVNSQFTFTVMDQAGNLNPTPQSNPGIFGTTASDVEEFDNDIEWAHAMAPGANIVAIALDSFEWVDIAAAIATANTLNPTVVTMSIQGTEYASNSYAGFFPLVDQAGIIYLACSGDYGGGMQYQPPHHSLEYNPMSVPGNNPLMVQVGGTHLELNGTTFTETAWGNGENSYENFHHHNTSGDHQGGGSNGGYSEYYARPSYQYLSPAVQANLSQFPSAATGMRLGPDISMVSQPGVDVYTSFDGWGGAHDYFYGTSIAAPMTAGVMAVAAQGRAAAGLPALGASDALYFLYQAPASAYTDIVAGNSGYPALPGYDLASGRGAVIANVLVPYLASASFATTTTLTVSQEAVEFGQAVTLTATVSGPTLPANVTNATAPLRAVSGLVTFMNGDVAVATVALVDGVATLTTQLGVGNHALTAVYIGNPASDYFSASTASAFVAVAVNPDLVMVSLILSASEGSVAFATGAGGAGPVANVNPGLVLANGSGEQLAVDSHGTGGTEGVGATLSDRLPGEFHGEALANSTLILEAFTNNQYTQVATAQPRPDGTFRFEGVPAGRYRLSLRSPQGSVRVIGFYDVKPASLSAAPAPADADALHDLDAFFASDPALVLPADEASCIVAGSDHEAAEALDTQDVCWLLPALLTVAGLTACYWAQRRWLAPL